MASLELQRGGWRIVFRYNGEKFQRTLETQDRGEAETQKARIEENLKLLRRGRLHYEPTDDLVTLLLSDGKLNANPAVVKRVSLGDFFKRYQANRPPGKEGNTTYTENIHIKHLLRVLGDRTQLTAIHGKLQRYVNTRTGEKSRSGGTISHVTVKKELGTLTSIWNKWGVREKLVPGTLSLANLAYSKGREKPPFQTWEQVLRKTKGDGESELWESVFLTVKEIEELLEHVRTKPSVIREHDRLFDFTYPMFAFAAYTGCRRSEMLRAMVEDVDLTAGQLTIREKKKDKSKETYRHVPIAASLRNVLSDWMRVHPGGNVLFCRTAGEPFTAQMAVHHFRWALEGSKWRVLRGWHAFRHSFISNLASRGIDQRVIMGLVGHLNPETTKRYSHLFPSSVQDAMRTVFGDGVRAAIANPG